MKSCKRTACIAGSYLRPVTQLRFCFFGLPHGRTVWECLRSYVIWQTDLLFNSNCDDFAKYVSWSRHFAGCYSPCLPHSGNFLILNFTTLRCEDSLPRIFEIQYLTHFTAPSSKWTPELSTRPSGDSYKHCTSTVYTAIGICHTGFADCLLAESGFILIPLASGQQNLYYIPIAMYTVPDSWWWTENLSETWDFYSKNKFEKLVLLVGFIIRLYHNARSSECQILLLINNYCIQALCCVRISLR